MNEQKLKTITRVGMWLAAIAGSIFGLLLIIIGYLLDWGPGGSTEGPLWRILLVGLPSALIGAYMGELIVRKLAKIMLWKDTSVLEFTIRSFAIVLLGSMAAFIAGWEIGYLMGKITGAIDGLDWIVVLIYTPLMCFLYSIPVCLITAVLFGVFVFFYQRGCLKSQQFY